MLSCKRLKGVHSYEVLAKELETINWVFGIENKIVNTTTDYRSNVERRLKLLKKNALMKRDQVVSAVLLMKTRYNQYDCYPFLKDIMTRKVLEYSCQNICVVHHTFLILWRLLMLARL